MGIALGQQAGQRRHGGQRRERGRVLHDLGGKALPQLDAEVAEVIGEPRLPGGVDVIADLQDGPQLARAPAVHQPQVPTVLAREQLEHGAGLAVRPHAQDHAFVAPVHGARLYTSSASAGARKSGRELVEPPWLLFLQSTAFLRGEPRRHSIAALAGYVGDMIRYVVLAALFLSACSNAEPYMPLAAPEAPAIGPSRDGERLLAIGTKGHSASDTRALTAAYNASGHELFRRFAAAPGNVVFSPYSIGTAMAMALSGARGDTEQEMAGVSQAHPRARPDRRRQCRGAGDPQRLWQSTPVFGENGTPHDG